MTDRWERLTDLYHAAVALPDDERASLLTEECADDPELLADVERLVAAHDRVSRPAAPPPVPAFAHPAPTPAFDRPVPTSPPSHVTAPAPDRCGPYRLLKEIGRGRLGVVHMGVRDDGRFDQRVAIEVVDRTADTDASLDGLRAAYGVLASHDHPTIARLIAVAATDDGRPYLVTEYVEGDPVDSFADDRRLSVAERLQLFVKVCNAVAYVHRCGVTHGALQPATILVTSSGLPKLFAFGTAGRATTDDDIKSLGALLELLLLGSVGNREHYDDPRNSLLNEVMERRTGIPITLAVVYLEVARRAGLRVAGINFPGHFLLRANEGTAGDGTDFVIIDPFHGGALLSEADCRELLRQHLGDEAAFDRTLLDPATRHHIIVRMLVNLKRLYVRMRSFPQARFISDLLLAVDPSATSELRDRGLLAYHLQDFAAALRDLEEYLRLAPRADRRSEPGVEVGDIDSELWEHVKNLRKRVAGFN